MKNNTGKKEGKKKKPLVAVGIASIDKLDLLASPTLSDYIDAVSEYVLNHGTLTDGQKKSAQIRLSGGLGRTLLKELDTKVKGLSKRSRAGETRIAGALRSAKADVSETDKLDGVRLAVEIKPVNLAVGRAIWNRFGDIRAFAVNVHLKFPFAVVGGVLVVPTFEITNELVKKSTLPLINKAIERLRRAGGRRTEAEASHLLEAICVLVYDPDRKAIDATVPAPNCGLRWEEFVLTLATTYTARFEF